MAHADAQTFVQSKVALRNYVTGKSIGNKGKLDSLKDEDDEYDPIYDIAFAFARTHGYGCVVFEDEQPKKPRKKNVSRTRNNQRFTGRTTYNTFLPHPPVKLDRRFPVHVVKYAPSLGDRLRRRCNDETMHILDSVVNDMKLIESVKTDIDMVKVVGDCLHKLDVIVPNNSEGAAPARLPLKKPSPKKRRSSSRTLPFASAISASRRKSASPPSKVSLSQQSLESARASPHQEGVARVSSTTEAIMSSATLDEFKNYLSTVCVKIFQEQPQLSPNANNPKAEAESSVRKCADGDTAGLDVDAYLKEKPPLLKSCSSTGRLANLKLKAKKRHSKSTDFLKKYYTRQDRKQEENQSLNNAPNDEVDETRDFDEDKPTHSKRYSPSSPKCADDTNKVHRLCNSISATVCQETMSSFSSNVKENRASNLPLAKIDFVRVQNTAVKMKSSTTHINQETCSRVLRRQLYGFPRTLKLASKITHSPPITRIRCNPHPRRAKFGRANNSCPSQVHAFESCHNLSLQQMGSSSKASKMLAFSKLQSGAGSVSFAASYGGVCQTEPNIAEERKTDGAKNVCDTSSSMNTETHILTFQELTKSEMVDQAVAPTEKEQSIPGMQFPTVGLFGDKQDGDVTSMNVSRARTECYVVGANLDSGEVQGNL